MSVILSVLGLGVCLFGAFVVFVTAAHEALTRSSLPLGWAIGAALVAGGCGVIFFAGRLSA